MECCFIIPQGPRWPFRQAVPGVRAGRRVPGRVARIRIDHTTARQRNRSFWSAGYQATASPQPWSFVLCGWLARRQERPRSKQLVTRAEQKVADLFTVHVAPSSPGSGLFFFFFSVRWADAG